MSGQVRLVSEGLLAKKLSPYPYLAATVEDGTATLEPFVDNQIDCDWSFSTAAGDGYHWEMARNESTWSLWRVPNGSHLPSGTDMERVEAAVDATTVVFTDTGVTATRSPQSFTVAVAASPVASTMRDLWFVVKGGLVAPTITWPSGFAPANGDSDNLLAEASATTVFLISEYAPGKYLVARQVVEEAAA